MALSKDDVKTIALTSAITAAASAVATTAISGLITYFQNKRDEAQAQKAAAEEVDKLLNAAAKASNGNGSPNGASGFGEHPYRLVGPAMGACCSACARGIPCSGCC